MGIGIFAEIKEINIMNEYGLQLISILKLVWLVGFAYLYAFGGIKNKLFRRYLAPLWLLIGISLFTIFLNYFSFWFLLYYPLLVGSLSLGYGADKPVEKIQKRTIYGLALGFAPLPLVIPTQSWVIFILHIVFCVVTNVCLGVINPMNNARDEETVIAVMAGLLPLYI